MAVRELRAAFLVLSLAGSPARAETLSVPFVANHGQVDREVSFYARTSVEMVYVTRAGKVVHGIPSEKAGRPGWTLTESFVDGKPAPRAGDPAITRVSYFQRSNRHLWHTGLPTCKS